MSFFNTGAYMVHVSYMLKFGLSHCSCCGCLDAEITHRHKGPVADRIILPAHLLMIRLEASVPVRLLNLRTRSGAINILNLKFIFLKFQTSNICVYCRQYRLTLVTNLSLHEPALLHY